jgi:RNA polymerase sigma-70 factor (ECF subfamily)
VPDPHSDLLARARLGEERALVELFRQHEPRLLRMIELRFDARLRRRLDPADVVQDAWVEVVRRFGEWRKQDALPFHVWLRLITGQALAQAQRRHLSAQQRDAMREASPRDNRPNISSANVADAFVDSATTPTQALVRDEVRNSVRAALDDLEEVDREIVAMRNFEALSNEEAALELGIEPSAASMRYMRALTRLRPALKALESGRSERAP